MYKTESTFPMPSPKRPSDQIQAWKSKGGMQLTGPFYIPAYIFSVPVFGSLYLPDVFFIQLYKSAVVFQRQIERS